MHGHQGPPSLQQVPGQGPPGPQGHHGPPGPPGQWEFYETNHKIIDLQNSLHSLKNDYSSLSSKYEALSAELRKSSLDMVHLIEFIEKIPKQQQQQSQQQQQQQQPQQQQQTGTPSQSSLALPDRSKVKTPITHLDNDITTSPLSKSSQSFEYELSKLKLTLLQRSYMNSRNSSATNYPQTSIVPQPYPLNPHYTIHPHNPREAVQFNNAGASGTNINGSHLRDRPSERHLSVLMDPLQVPVPSRHNSKTGLLLPEQQQQPPSSQPIQVVHTPPLSQPKPQVQQGPQIIHPQPSTTPQHQLPQHQPQATPLQGIPHNTTSVPPPPGAGGAVGAAGGSDNSPLVRTYQQYPFPSQHNEPPKSNSVEPRTPDPYSKASDLPPRSIPAVSNHPIFNNSLDQSNLPRPNQLPSVSELDQSIKSGNSPVYSLLNTMERPLVRKIKSEDEERFKRRKA